VYINTDPEDVTGSVEYALACVIAAAAAERKLRDSRRKQPYGVDYAAWLQQLSEEGVIDEAEAALLQESAVATRRIVMVDDFPNSFLQGKAG
jgi:uncharacterized protein YutE (UPF0331/DUF86 family)